MILDREKVENRWIWLLSCHRSWVPESIKRVKKKVMSQQSLTYQWMAPFIVSICFAASSHNTTRWISLAFPDWYVFVFLLILSLFHLFLLFLFPSPRQDDSSCKRSCHIPLLNPTQDTCLLRRMRCVMKASFLRENWLSTVTSFPSFELITVAFPHHTCLYSTSTGELTGTPLIWVGGEEERCPETPLFLVVFRGRSVLQVAGVFLVSFSKPSLWHVRLVLVACLYRVELRLNK